MTLQLSSPDTATGPDDWEAPEDPDVSHLITEDDTPVDNLFSEKQQRLLTESLYASWTPEQGRPEHFVVMANVGLFFSPEEQPLVPDVLLSLDVRVPPDLWEKKNRSYFVWKYGKQPDLVLEVVSNREGHENEKIARYARQGIGYYVILDPTRKLSDRPVRAFELRGVHYAEILPARVALEGGGVGSKFAFPELKLGLTEWRGLYEEHHDTWLRWTDGSDTLLCTGAERAAQAEERAQSESARAEQAEERARSQSERAEKLAQKLRELGIEE